MNNTIQILNTFFYVCAILAGIFFLLSVILFFVFDIRSIFNIRTGRAKKRTVQEMQDANSRTDMLKVSKTGQRVRRGSSTGPLGAAPTSKRLRHGAKITQPPQPLQNVELQYAAAKDIITPETELLAPETELLAPETELLAPETSVLRSQPVSEQEPETSVITQHRPEKQLSHDFKVTKRIMLINTEEVVP